MVKNPSAHIWWCYDDDDDDDDDDDYTFEGFKARRRRKSLSFWQGEPKKGKEKQLGRTIRYVLHNLVTFVQFKKLKKHLWRVLLSLQVY